MLYGCSFYNLKMYPYKYQLELIKKYDQDNEQAMLQLAYAESLGHTITSQLSLSGPYMNHTTYLLSNGSMITLVTPASLFWATSCISLSTIY